MHHLQWGLLTLLHNAARNFAWLASQAYTGLSTDCAIVLPSLAPQSNLQTVKSYQVERVSNKLSRL